MVTNVENTVNVFFGTVNFNLNLPKVTYFYHSKYRDLFVFLWKKNIRIDNNIGIKRIEINTNARHFCGF